MCLKIRIWQPIPPPPPGRGHELSAMSSNTKGSNYLLEIPGVTAVCFLIVDLARDHRDACTYVELVSCHLYKGMSLSSNRGGEGCHLRVVPPGQLLRRPSTPKPSSNQVLLFFWREVFCVCFPVVFALRLLCLFSNSFQFKFFIYSLYIHFYIFYIFCTCGALQCSHGLWSLCRASSRWQTRSPAVGALWVYS